MRLGECRCQISEGTLAGAAYREGQHRPLPKKKPLVALERHRHRYELNNEFKSLLEEKGMIISGINPERNLIEIIELKNHPFFVGVQFHPEFKSRPLKPHPLYREFLKIAIRRSRS
jgi:CTP synthase